MTPNALIVQKLRAREWWPKDGRDSRLDEAAAAAIEQLQAENARLRGEASALAPVGWEDGTNAR